MLPPATQDIGSTYQDSPELPVQLKGSGFEVLVILDEGLVLGVKAVVGPVGEDAEQLLIEQIVRS